MTAFLSNPLGALQDALNGVNKSQLSFFGSVNGGINSFFGNAYTSLIGGKGSLLNKLYNMSPTGMFAGMSSQMKIAVIAVVVLILGVVGVIAMKTML